MLLKAQRRSSLAETHILKAKPFTSEAGEEIGRSSSSLYIQHPFKGPDIWKVLNQCLFS